MVMRSPERGQIWEKIAAAELTSLQQPKFRVIASQELFEIGIHFQNKNKNCATKRKPPESREDKGDREGIPHTHPIPQVIRQSHASFTN